MSGPIRAQESPYRLAAEVSRMSSWCACGRRTSQPLCDGSHKGGGLTPVPPTLSKPKEVWPCGCKASGGKPFYDGPHSRL